jgi:hypothetical protein
MTREERALEVFETICGATGVASQETCIAAMLAFADEIAAEKVAREREACATLVKDQTTAVQHPGAYIGHEEAAVDSALLEAAAAIRNRKDET